MPKKPVFGIFSRFHHQFFLIFLHKNAYQQMAKTWPSSISKKNFFRPKMPKMYRKLPFLQNFIELFPYIFCFIFFSPYTFLVLLPFLFPFYIYHQVDQICIALVFLPSGKEAAIKIARLFILTNQVNCSSHHGDLNRCFFA